MMWRLARSGGGLLGLAMLALVGAGIAMPTRAADSLCARVVIEIVQELTIERQGFEARLAINNGLTGIPIENVRVDVGFTDENGDPVQATTDPSNTDAAFFIRQDRLSGIGDVSGTGQVAPNTTAEATWLIVPAPGSAGTTPDGKLYLVGATIRYRLSGEDKEVTAAPDSIVVRPMPQLVVDYFLPREVYADDPFTPQIEAVEPFPLGVRVRNTGQGTAYALAIDSAQPRIVENQLGLLIDFRITGSSVNDAAEAPRLDLGLGDLAPSAAVSGRWIMETTLSGEFVEFSADYSHADELGGALTSLMESVTTHRLVHDVLVDAAGRDTVRDFLARDGDGLRVYESSGVDVAVTDQSGAASLTLAGQSGDTAEYQLTAPATAGAFYCEVADPYQGRFAVTEVRRADGKRLPAANAWTSRRPLGSGQWDYRLHLFDIDTSGRYLLGMAPKVQEPTAPVLQFIPDRTVQVGTQVSFIVESSDPNGTIPTLTVQPLPAGASFVPDPNGAPQIATQVFDWTPTAAQEAAWDLTYTASDGALETRRTARITVCGLTDTDCDGMNDAWERLHFGNLGRDGTGDFDGDGLTDLEEFKRGTDPTLKDAPGVPAITQPLDGAQVTSLQPLLAVNNSTHAASATVSYRFEVFADAGLTDQVTAVTLPEQVQTTGWSMDTPLSENQSYWWRVRACAESLCSEWAQARLFVNTANDPPGAFHLSTPADGTDVGTHQPTLEVTNALDPDGDPLTYRFEVYADASLTTRVAMADGIGAGPAGATAWMVDPALDENTWYFWRVTATDPSGADRVCTDDGRFFVNTVNTPPTRPGIVAPADGAVVTQQALTLEVGNALDPDDLVLDYLFEIDRAATFDTAQKRSSGPLAGGGGGTTGWPVDGLVENATYFWRAKADDGLAQSNWAQAHFTVNVLNEPPTTPTVQNPGNAAWVDLVRPRLVLNPATDPDGDPIRYRFELYGDAALTTRLGEHAADTTDWQLDFDLADNTWYFWRARAQDDQGLASEWTDRQGFFVNDNGFDDPPTITLVQPAEDIRLSSGQVRIAWTDADPDSDARIRLFYTRQGGSGPAVTIAATIPEDPDGEADSWLWDISGVPAGTYRIGALIEDASGQLAVEAPGKVEVGGFTRGGITVTRTSQPNTTEAGVSSSFSVTLDSAPTATVSVPLSSSDTTEGLVSPETLTFTPSTWSIPQRVTVTGVDDCAPDGNVDYQLLIGPATSTDPAYDGIEPQPMPVTNLDNDAPGGHPTLHICNYTLVDKQRYGRLDYDYRFRVQLTNTGAAVSGVAASLGSSNPVTTVIDGQVTFGPVGAGATALSTDTFTIRQNRSYPFDPAALQWQASPQP